MKKMLLAVSVCCIQYTQAQTTVNFEELALPGADTAWLGSDQSGGFTSNGIHFQNTYTVSQWGNYWSDGYVYSNSTNSTNGSYTLDYSAFPGTGANGSSNYAVNYGESALNLPGEKTVLSIDVTNTTYAGLSMINGDSFAKQFGSTNNAAGEPDGTNGEDWFRLLIIGKDSQNNSTDTVIFYLADYRFPDNSQDYVVNTWETIDLTSLGTIVSIDFQLESSDNGEFGMNTPVYFALDNIVYDDPQTAGVHDLSSKAMRLFPNPAADYIQIHSETGELSVISMAGERMLHSQTNGLTELNLATLPSGMYLVELKSEKGISRTRINKI